MVFHPKQPLLRGSAPKNLVIVFKTLRLAVTDGNALAVCRARAGDPLALNAVACCSYGSNITRDCGGFDVVGDILINWGSLTMDFSSNMSTVIQGYWRTCPQGYGGVCGTECVS